MVGKHGWLAMVAGLAVGVSIGLVNLEKVQAESKVPVRTAVLTSSDKAAAQATPVHWGGWYGGRGYYGGYRPFYGAYYRPYYRPYYPYYRPYVYRPYYAPYYAYPYYAAYPSVYTYSYPAYAPYPYYSVAPYGGYYYW
jgi:hypothetical protein